MKIRIMRRLALIAAITRPEDRTNEPAFNDQIAFYGPMHGVIWNMLHLVSRLSPHNIARQTMAIFSNHDPEDTLRRLTPDDIKDICRFYQRHSSRVGALNDLTHIIGKELLQKVQTPTLVIHSREDRSVPFSHAEWSLAQIPHAELCKSGFTGHFYWVGSDYQRAVIRGGVINRPRPRSQKTLARLRRKERKTPSMTSGPGSRAHSYDPPPASPIFFENGGGVIGRDRGYTVAKAGIIAL